MKAVEESAETNVKLVNYSSDKRKTQRGNQQDLQKKSSREIYIKKIPQYERNIIALMKT